MNKNLIKILLGLLVLSLLIIFSSSNELRYLDLKNIKENATFARDFYGENQMFFIFGYVIIYILSTSVSLPLATFLTLVGGAVFGHLHAILLVSFASTVGATLNFLLARFILKDFIQKKFKKAFVTINNSIISDGKTYLLSLRLIPLFPFFLINLIMGLTPMRIWPFFWVSQVGMLPATIIYVNAGVEIAQINSIESIFSYKLIVALTLIGLLPLIGKFIIKIINKRKIYKNYKKPKSFDYNMVVIGGGAAGLVTSYVSAAANAKVALIESNKMGGDCLNTGCVPSKAIIKTAKILHYFKHSKEYGIENLTAEIRFKDVMARVKKVISKIEPNDSSDRYKKLGVECINGKAKITSPWEVAIGERTITTRSITIATGATPLIPQIAGLTSIDYLTSETIWSLEELPKKLLVLGGGPLGCELAQCFARLGSQVTLVEKLDKILNRGDKEVSKFLQQQFAEEGIIVYTSCQAKMFKTETSKSYLLVSHHGKEKSLSFDKVLVALGRKANTANLGLEKLGIKLASNGMITVDKTLRTNIPNIFASGDVCGPFQLTHASSYQAWFCAVNGLFDNLFSLKANYSNMPEATFTDPEVATVGLNEKTANYANIKYETTLFALKNLDRAIVDGNDKGFVKILTVPKKDKILGVTIVGQHASSLISEFVLALNNNLGLKKIIASIHIYPSLTEANKNAAVEWQREHLPNNLLKITRSIHRWRRS